jgi:copper oxidase (laccase) domain-containing protein
VLERAVEALGPLDPGPLTAVLGPCIHPECYEFGEEDLARVAAAVGGAARATTAAGAPALDVPAAVSAVLRRLGVAVANVDAPCTACDPDHWSFRAGGDLERQGMAVWVEPS